MKHSYFLIALFLALAIKAGAQEHRGVQLELVVSNDVGREQLLTVGVFEGASSGLDPMLGEAELPPQPPNEIFDARCSSTPGASQLGTGSHNDFRPIPTTGNIFSVKFTIAYQAGINAQEIKLAWPENYSGRITRLLVDDVDMAGKTEVTSSFMTGQFLVEVFLDMSPLTFTATPNPMTFIVNNKDELPSQNLVIRPLGDTKAIWTLDMDESDWLHVEPMAGEGEMTVVVSITTRLLPAGDYSGMIKVRSAVYPARLDIPVTMTMIVGVPGVPHPGSLWIGQNYPNPFNPATMIDIDLGSIQADLTPYVQVHDMLGREVADLSSEVRLQTGRQSLMFNAAGLPGGVYTYTLRYGSESFTRSMVLLK